MSEAKSTLFTLTPDHWNKKFSSLDEINEFISPLGVSFDEHARSDAETTYSLGFIGQHGIICLETVGLTMETLLEMTIDELHYFVIHSLLQYLLSVRNFRLEDRFTYSHNPEDYYWALMYDEGEWPWAFTDHFSSLSPRLVMPIDGLNRAEAD